MDKFHTRLVNLLKRDARFTDENGELIYAALVNHADKMDRELVKALLRDKEIKEAFFKEIEGHWIFDANAFIDYVGDKNFLDNSYTRFHNKIGLNIGDKFLRERGEVTLVWPYKDCVLEGGQTREDQKRDKELFFNETLAKDEIGRMFDPKALTGWQRYSAEDSENGRVGKIKRDADGVIQENMLIKGNNLIALHSLIEQFRDKVRLIYIDPPYNTGSSVDSFTYNNAFKHSTWLTFMRNRMEIARNLLAPDGFIAIAIDHNEMFYLGVLADEIFGRENRLGVVSVVHKPEGRSQEKFFGTSNEFMFVYAKDKSNASFRKVLISENKKATFNLEDEKGKYKLRSFIRGEGLREDKPHLFYPIYVSADCKTISLAAHEGFHKILPVNNGVERVWYTKSDSFPNRIEDGEIVAQKNKSGEIKLFYKVREVEVFTTHWVDKKYNAAIHGTKLLDKILGRKSVSYPKSLYTVIDIIKITADEDSIVLDFFAGSGTTGHAVLELNKEDGGNRQFILVEQLDQHVDVCKERLEKVMARERLMGDEFLYCELAPYNQSFMDRIQAAQSSEELLRLWKKISKKSFLNWYVNHEDPDNALENLKAVGEEPDGLGKQKDLLAKLMDKNQLYVHYSEIDDPDFNISEEDKELTRQFYEGGSDDS